MTRPDLRPHADHDPSLVAAFAAGDASGSELGEATALVAACAHCATLHRDLRAIAAALPAMPVPVRTRDFRITAEQAAALRPRGFARLLAPLASARFAFAGPAGTGLAALGIVGILLSGGLGQMVLPASMGAPVENSGAGVNTPALSAPSADTNGSVAGQAQPLPSDRATSMTVSGADASAGALLPEASLQAGPKQAYGSVERLEATPLDGAAPAPAPMTTAAPAGIPPVTLVGSLLVVVGLLMGGLRLLARRVA